MLKFIDLYAKNKVNFTFYKFKNKNKQINKPNFWTLYRKDMQIANRNMNKMLNKIGHKECKLIPQYDATKYPFNY